jgi:hypothetical protein
MMRRILVAVLVSMSIDQTLYFVVAWEMGVVIFGVNEVVQLRSWRLDDRKPQTAQISRRRKQEVLSSRN